MGAGQQTIPFTIFESQTTTTLVLPIKSSVTSKGWGSIEKKEIVKTVKMRA